MKRSDLKTLLPDITDEQLNQIMSWNGDDINREKGAAQSLQTQLNTATERLSQFDGVDVAALQQQVTELQSQLKQNQVDAAVKVALLGANAADVDYLTYKLKEQGELELDEKGAVKGMDELLSGLKTKFPTQFTSAAAGRRIEEHRLPDQAQQVGGGLTKEDLLKKPYAERQKIYEQDPAAFNEIMRG